MQRVLFFLTAKAKKILHGKKGHCKMKSPFEKALAQKYIGQIVDEPLFF